MQPSPIAETSRLPSDRFCTLTSPCCRQTDGCSRSSYSSSSLRQATPTADSGTHRAKPMRSSGDIPEHWRTRVRLGANGLNRPMIGREQLPCELDRFLAVKGEPEGTANAVRRTVRD